MSGMHTCLGYDISYFPSISIFHFGNCDYIIRDIGSEADKLVKNIAHPYGKRSCINSVFNSAALVEIELLIKDFGSRGHSYGLVKAIQNFTSNTQAELSSETIFEYVIFTGTSRQNSEKFVHFLYALGKTSISTLFGCSSFFVANIITCPVSIVLAIINCGFLMLTKLSGSGAEVEVLVDTITERERSHRVNRVGLWLARRGVSYTYLILGFGFCQFPNGGHLLRALPMNSEKADGGRCLSTENGSERGKNQ